MLEAPGMRPLMHARPLRGRSGKLKTRKFPKTYPLSRPYRTAQMRFEDHPRRRLVLGKSRQSTGGAGGLIHARYLNNNRIRNALNNGLPMLHFRLSPRDRGDLTCKSAVLPVGGPQAVVHAGVNVLCVKIRMRKSRSIIQPANMLTAAPGHKMQVSTQFQARLCKTAP
ncbi:hypothetical protein EJ03DRAFT_17744 [Teratosphaeria nubilosa]|uniref:Uncharacterized protein n=1 Tax=Teratosphaeria nubilosa TaxID=161662 RepID=A0A6G1KVJ2_9PEZI|nr:hypothetical protein EJ03DRAFT_17744 [Teratosphaeria nubilosa]